MCDALTSTYCTSYFTFYNRTDIHCCSTAPSHPVKPLTPNPFLSATLWCWDATKRLSPAHAPVGILKSPALLRPVLQDTRHVSPTPSRRQAPFQTLPVYHNLSTLAVPAGQSKHISTYRLPLCLSTLCISRTL